VDHNALKNKVIISTEPPDDIKAPVGNFKPDRHETID
jgi:hypothetical protein